jgi:alcohol dehydrogenase
MKAHSAVLRSAAAERPYTATRPLRVEEVELDLPAPGELLVEIKAAGLCHSDLSVVNGDRSRPLPMALGHEAAGEVLTVGAGVRDVVPGDHVVLVYVPSCGRCRFCSSGEPALCEVGAAANTAGELVGGGSRLSGAGRRIHHHLGVSAFSTHAVVDRASAVVIDGGVPFDVAALFGCAMLTGFGAVTHTGDVRLGDTVAVFGLGGVGQAVVMTAAAAGARAIIAIDPVPSKRALAAELGATHTCGPEQASDVIEATTPGGVRWAFEVVGSAAVIEAAYRATARGGATIAVGLPHPDATLTLPALSIVAMSRRILGSYMGSAQPQIDIPVMIDLWRAGRLPVEKLKSDEMPMHRLNEALESLADGTAVRQILIP